jgi:very-short-patch-repair endonuclease
VLPEPAIDLLRDQYGVLAWHQLPDELTSAERRRIGRHPELERLTPRVLRHRIATPCREQRVLAGVLDAGPGGQLWGKSSSSLWGFGRFQSERPHVAVPRTVVRGQRLCEVHVVRHLVEGMTSHLSIPTARPEETVLWIAGMWTHRWGPGGIEIAIQRTGRTLDHAWRLGLIDGRRIHELCAVSGGRGRSGIVVLRQLLEERPPDYRPSGSALEDRFESTLPASIRAQLERQVPLGDDRPIGIVDYCHRTRPLVVEINGEVFHSSLTDRAADEERYRRLVTAGYEVLVVWEYDVFHQPHRIVRALEEVLARPHRPRLIRPTNAPWVAW